MTGWMYGLQAPGPDVPATFDAGETNGIRHRPAPGLAEWCTGTPCLIQLLGSIPDNQVLAAGWASARRRLLSPPSRATISRPWHRSRSTVRSPSVSRPAFRQLSWRDESAGRGSAYDQGLHGRAQGALGCLRRRVQERDLPLPARLHGLSRRPVPRRLASGNG